MFPPLPPHPLDLLEQPFARGLKFQLFPFHTEILKDIYIHPIILTLLSRHRLDLLNRLSTFLLAEIVYIKLLDATDSIETTLEIRISEYEHHYNELMKRYNNNNIRSIYLYDTPHWWCEHINRFISIQIVPQKRPLTFVSRISKKKIERFLMGIIDPTYVSTPVSVPVPVPRKLTTQSSHATYSPPAPLAAQVPVSNANNNTTHHTPSAPQRLELESIDNELALAGASSVAYSEDSLYESSRIHTHEPVSSHSIATTKATVEYDVFSEEVFDDEDDNSPPVESQPLTMADTAIESVYSQTAVVTSPSCCAVYPPEEVAETSVISPAGSVTLGTAAEALLQQLSTDGAYVAETELLAKQIVESSDALEPLSSEEFNGIPSPASQIPIYEGQVETMATYEDEYPVSAETKSLVDASASTAAFQPERHSVEPLETVAETNIHTSVHDTDTASVTNVAASEDEDKTAAATVPETSQSEHLIEATEGLVETLAVYDTETPWSEYPVETAEGQVEAEPVYDTEEPRTDYLVETKADHVEAAAVYETKEPWAEYPVETAEGQVEAAAVYETEEPWTKYPVETADQGQVEAAAVYETEEPWSEYPLEAAEGQVEAAAVYETEEPWTEYPVETAEGQVEAAAVYDTEEPWTEYPVETAEQGQVEAAAVYETEEPWTEYPLEAAEGQVEAPAVYETEEPWTEAEEGQVEASAEFEDLPWVFYGEPEDSAPAAPSSMTDPAASSAEEYVPSEAATDMETANSTGVYSTDEGLEEGQQELPTKLTVDKTPGLQDDHCADTVPPSHDVRSLDFIRAEVIQSEASQFIDRILATMISEIVERSYAPASNHLYTAAQTDPGGESYPLQPSPPAEGNEMISNEEYAPFATNAFTLENPTIYPTFSTDAEEEPEDDYDYGSYDDDAYETKCALTPKERNMTAFFYTPILAKKEVNNIIQTAIENVLVMLHAVK